MELKFPELRAELVEHLQQLEDMCHDLKGHAENRPEWHDDEDDCLLAAHAEAINVEFMLVKVRDILDEMP